MDDLATLRLQIEWGADEALEDAPVDRLHVLVAVSPADPLPRAEGGTASKPPTPLAAGGSGAAVPQASTAVERAVQSAAAATTLEELRAAVAAFDGCALRDTASHLVFAAGDPTAALLVIGDPPSSDDDRAGTPLAGDAGAYFDRMLGSIGLARAQLLLAPLIPWRPPGGRAPSPAELAQCLPFLHRLIALTAPRRLLLLGPLAARSLLPASTSRRRPRGAWMDTATLGLSALPTSSPAELLRSPKDRRAAWADLRLLRRTLDGDS